MARIYTGTGDEGMTSIHGGDRVEKDSTRIEANGTLDELNSIVGAIRAYNLKVAGKEEHNPQIEELLKEAQSVMMPLMSLVATTSDSRCSNPRVFDANIVAKCEGDIERLRRELGSSNSFVLPQGTMMAALLQFARSIARRAERRLWTLHKEDPLPKEILQYINRLSDLLFVMALHENRRAGCDEEKWENFYSYKRMENGQ